ncbi:glutathione S-transferase [Daldinia grandis]|nr:glutathione S-transferase [Daldinia grandis]
MDSNTKPLILHAHATGPNPIKLAAALEFLKVPSTTKMWEFGDDPQKGVKGTAFLKINENGRVPALEDPNTGVVSWESGACMNYLRRVYDRDGKVLGPRGKGEQDVVDFEKWEYFLLTTLGPMTEQTNWYSVLEGQLKKTGGDSILPRGITAVDLHFEPWVRQHSYAQISLDPYPTVKKWLEKMDGLKEIQEAYRKIKEAPKP